MIVFNIIIVFIYILQSFHVTSTNLSIEAKKEICIAVVESNKCNNTVLREFVCDNCQKECNNKITPDCNEFIGNECKDYYDYCSDVKSLCNVDYMKSFLDKYCPITCNKCIPIEIDLKTTTQQISTRKVTSNSTVKIKI